MNTNTTTIAPIVPIAFDKNGVEIYSRADVEHYHRPDLHAEALKKIELPKEKGYLKVLIDMGHTIGVDHLVETTQDDEIVYLKRGNRPGFSRMVLNREAKETKVVTAILCKNNDASDPDFLPGTEGKWVLATLFEGDPGEKEVWDRAFFNADKDPEIAKELVKSWKFWATHALVAKPNELDDIRKGYSVSFQFIEKSFIETNSYANPGKAFNGGGYSQPAIELEFIDGMRCHIYDTSCGDFGSRISAEFKIGNEVWDASWGSMEKRYESNIPNEMFCKHIKLVEEWYGYHIPTKEQCAKWDAEEEAEWDDEEVEWNDDEVEWEDDN